jgi:hypothetical protein
VVLFNCTNQLVMHILNVRLRSIVEKAGILEPCQSGGRQGRSTDINLTKLECVTREALAQGKRVYRVDVDFTNAFNAMSQAALWAVMRAYGIPDVDVLMSLYEHSTVRMAPNDLQCATITFDTGVAQGSALSSLLFLIFMNALLGLLTDTGQKLRISHGLKCGVQLRRKEATPATEHVESEGQFNLIGFVDDLAHVNDHRTCFFLNDHRTCFFLNDHRTCFSTVDGVHLRRKEAWTTCPYLHRL